MQFHFFFLALKKTLWLTSVIADEEDSESDSASVDSEEEGSKHHLLTPTNGDVNFIKEKPMALQ